MRLLQRKAAVRCCSAPGRDTALLPARRLSAFIHALVLRAFSSSIVTRGLSNGLMRLTGAKHAERQSQSSSQILKPPANTSLPPASHAF